MEEFPRPVSPLLHRPKRDILTPKSFSFIEVFQETAKKMEEEAKNSSKAGDIEWLLQGTLYPDVIESIAFRGDKLS